jgi:hypothetical protein
MKATTSHITHHALVMMVAAFVLLVALAVASIRAAQDRVPGSAFLAGTWTLDPYLSDHPEQVARALRLDTRDVGEDLSGRQDESGRQGSGAGERGGGNGRSGTGPGPAKERISEGDRKLLSALTDAVRFPPTTLTISQTGTAVTLVTGAGASTTLQTNGKAEKLQVGAGTVDRTAAWEGPHLAVAYDIGHAGTLTYDYGLAPTTGQLVIRVNFERRRGEPGPFDIKLVYNAARPAGTARPRQ